MKLISSILFLAVLVSEAGAQELVILLKQERDNMPASHLSGAELASLGDPLFRLVLREHAAATTLREVEELLQPTAAKRQVFVVDENIRDPRLGQARRTVLTFTGTQSGEVLDANVMLSVLLDGEGIPEAPRFIEAWGWDNQRGRYNFYKLDRTGTPDQRLSWKFRGSSVGADLLTPADRRDTCLSCHVSGAPIMKELLRPWNNWHSFDSTADYLLPTAPEAERWPAAVTPRLRNLKGAEDLESMILSSIRQFNTRRVNEGLQRRDRDADIAIDAEGMATVVDGKRLLRSLFVTTEFNIISSLQKSRLHPFPRPTMTGPAAEVILPDSFFLNANLISGATAASYQGLGIREAQEFRTIAKLTPQEYKGLVTAAGLQLGRHRPADADFAWLTPEPSHVDNDLVDRLLRRGIVTPQFAAAVLGIDLERPLLSEQRAALLRFVPDRFRFVPRGNSGPPNRHPDDLTRQVIAGLEAAAQRNASEDRFLAVLRSADPLTGLRSAIQSYRERVRKALGDPAGRAVELRRLHDLLIKTRTDVLRHEVLGTINETGDRLFPLSDLILLPRH